MSHEVLNQAPLSSGSHVLHCAAQAAGSSAPELFTSLLTVLTTQNSAGVGTILGSAVFNLVARLIPTPLWT